jgi:rhamnosyltransferase
MQNHSIDSVSAYKVAVLMTCYNGEKFIESQINSILCQSLCEVKIFVSDDNSTDSSLQILEKFAFKHPHSIYLSVTGKNMGSAGKNFFHLIEKYDCDDYDFVAFSDQDDIWQPDHLLSAIKISLSERCHGISSNVLAFFPDGRTKVYRKNKPQKRYDFFFESPGPGCTFVLTKPLYVHVRDVLIKNKAIVNRVFHHDWLIYAVARSANFKWFIREAPLVHYRQHGTNETGARIGFKSMLVRLKKMRSGWYGDQIHHVATVVCATGCMDRDPLLRCLVSRKKYYQIFWWITQTRRTSVDQLFFCFAIFVRWIK